MEHLSTFNIVCTVFTSVQAEHRVNCASAVQMLFTLGQHRLKMYILYSQKFHRTNVPSSEKWGKGSLF